MKNTHTHKGKQMYIYVACKVEGLNIKQAIKQVELAVPPLNTRPIRHFTLDSSAL